MSILDISWPTVFIVFIIAANLYLYKFIWASVRCRLIEHYENKVFEYTQRCYPKSRATGRIVPCRALFNLRCHLVSWEQAERLMLDQERTLGPTKDTVTYYPVSALARSPQGIIFYHFLVAKETETPGGTEIEYREYTLGHRISTTDVYILTDHQLITDPDKAFSEGLDNLRDLVVPKVIQWLFNIRRIC